MSDTSSGPAPPSAADRAARVQELLDRLRPDAEQVRRRRLAERLVELPDDQAVGQVEYDLRDLAHELAATAPQAGLEAGTKRGTKAPAPSVPTAPRTPASSRTTPRAG